MTKQIKTTNVRGTDEAPKNFISAKPMLAAALSSRQITLSNAKKLIDSPICTWFDCHCRKLSGNHKWNVYMSDDIGENHSLENFIKDNDDNYGSFWLSVDFKNNSKIENAMFQILDDVSGKPL